MTQNIRRPLALLSLAAALMASFALVQNNDLRLSNDVSGEIAGIEGEEIPLPYASQLAPQLSWAHG